MSALFGRYVIGFILLLGPILLCAQSKKELEEQRKELNSKINYTSKLINKNLDNVEKQQSELVILDRQINFRQDLISTIYQELQKINELISEQEANLAKLEDELQKLKDNYAELIRQSYRTRNVYNKMMFVFASEDINQAYKRLSYMRQLATYRKNQGIKIQEKQEEILKELSLLQARKDEKQILLGSQEQEKNKLVNDKDYKDKTVQKLKQEAGKLKKQLKEQENRKREIAKEIERLIAREIEENRKKSETGKYTLSPAATALSSSFESNKGKLPWPVEKGIITRRFGRQAHPFVAGVYVNNDGINFNSEKGANVRAIFNGTVSSILLIPGEGKVVVINHGAYRSVYTKLQNVTVRKGDTVSTQSVIGQALGTDGDNASEMHLEIWKISETEKQKLDPAKWLTGI